MANNWQKIKKFKYDLLILFLGFFTLTYMVKFYAGQALDIKIHNFLLVDYLKEGAFPSPPGYYALIYLVDLLFRYKYPFVVSSILVLTFFYWWKFRISFNWLSEREEIKPKHAFFLILSLLFLSPIFIPSIDGSYWYFGKFTPTIWHNSTLIAVFPFCILLVWKTLDWFESKQNRYIIQILILSILVMLIKPSFMFCYIPAISFFAFVQYPEQYRIFRQTILISLSLFVLLVLEKIWIFDLDPMIENLYTEAEKSNVVLNPFRVHLYFSKEPFFDFFTSFPSTFIFFILWGKQAFSSKFVTFSFILLIFAIAVYLLLAETGIREFHGNFYWQIPIALFLHYLSLVLFAFRKYLENGSKLNYKGWIFSTIFLIQVGFGLVYFYRLFFGYALN